MQRNKVTYGILIAGRCYRYGYGYCTLTQTQTQTLLLRKLRQTDELLRRTMFDRWVENPSAASQTIFGFTPPHTFGICTGDQ
jgi:hypothetical protein